MEAAKDKTPATTTVGIPAPVRAQQFVEIAEPEDVFPWQYTDPDTKQKFASVFHLRIVPEDIQTFYRKQYTKPTWDAGRRVEDVDWAAFTNDCLDYCITKWEQVKSRGVDLPCERKYKVLLPDRIQTEIIKLCVGKELGRAQDPTTR
jgi:hypothetical protein